MTFSVLGRGPGNHGYEPRTVWDLIQSPIATDMFWGTVYSLIAICYGYGSGACVCVCV